MRVPGLRGRPQAERKLSPSASPKNASGGPVWHALGVAAPEVGALLTRYRHWHDREARGFASLATG